MAQTKKQPSAFVRFFRSVRLTLSILILLALTSVIGTLIPQQQDAMAFGRDLSPWLFKLLTTLGLFDMYHSAWFRILILGLALNLVVCSLDRFPKAWTLFRASPRAHRERIFEEASEALVLQVNRPQGDAAREALDALRKGFRRVGEERTGTEAFFYGEKGRFSHFGVYLVHLSVLLILIGGLVGSLFGFEAYVNIVEGETVDRVFSRKTMQPMALDFSVRCDRFSVAFYEGGMPREYRSTLSFLKDGAPPEAVDVLVNHPVTFEGVTFYQSSYGKVPGRRVRILLERKGPGGETRTLEVDATKPVPLPGGEGHFEIHDLREDVMGLGPAALIAVRPASGNPVEFWVFQSPEKVRRALPEPMLRSGKFNAEAFSPYRFGLEGIEVLSYTGLQVNRDPGVPLVWSGFFLMMGGLFVTFFTAHRRIWIRVRALGEGAEIRIAGTCSKNPVGLEREMTALLRGLARKEEHRS